MAATSEVLMAELSTIREPRYGVRVHKDECVLSFSSPETAGGLYVCMRSFLGLGVAHVECHHARTGQRAYLHILRTRKKEEDGGERDHQSMKKKSPPTRLAIGVEGGFDVEAEPQYEQRVTLVLFPDRQEVTSEELRAMPEEVREAVGRSWNAILSADSASHGLRVAQWDGEERRASRHATGLRQLDNGVKVGVAGPWRCEEEGCGLTQNLWMNLTDGKVLCGRSQYGVLEGNDHAVQHFHQTGFPLAVKLGTVTPEGADIHSYEEKDMVLDPRLREHLAHFGLDMDASEKTERTITDLELAVNQREWDSIQEAGSALRPLSGPGLTGMRNLGNSCYLNAVMQVLFTVPDFRSKYVTDAERFLDEAPLADPTQDFNMQTAKLGRGLLSGDFSRAAPPCGGPGDKNDASGEQVGIAPRMFKALVGRGHAEFSTNRQQDAQEFLMHVLDLAERHRGAGPDPAEAFRFLVEERIECGSSRRAKYARRADYSLQLPVPMDRATNLAELREAPEGSAVRARVPFSACMAALSEPETLADFWSSAARAKTTATKTTRFASFPDHLVIAVKKFTFSGADLTPRKLDVSIDVPDSLDLSALRGTGRRPGEELLPEEEEEEEVDEEVLSTLCELGFSREACRKAVRQTDGRGVDAAVNWLMDHSEDPDLSSPPPLALATPTGAGHWGEGGVSEERFVSQIMEMNFSREQAVRALRATGNADVERALDWILNQDPEDPFPSTTEPTAPPSQAPPPRDGPGRYELFAFISHMGSSTLCGHYVCHIKKDDSGWVIFNDQKVCASENPPKDLGYLYFYRRVTCDP